MATRAVDPAGIAIASENHKECLSEAITSITKEEIVKAGAITGRFDEGGKR